MTFGDEDVIASYPRLITRTGGKLVVGGAEFVDEGDCFDPDDCIRYRADDVWQDRYVGVEVSYYEGVDYYLVDNGVFEQIGAKPIFSPSGERFFAGYHDDSIWNPHHGAAVWAAEPVLTRLRIVDTGLVMYDSFTAWHGEACVEFTGARGYNVALEPVQTFWLAEQDGDWRLFEERPEVCG